MREGRAFVHMGDYWQKLGVETERLLHLFVYPAVEGGVDDDFFLSRQPPQQRLPAPQQHRLFAHTLPLRQCRYFTRCLLAEFEDVLAPCAARTFLLQRQTRRGAAAPTMPVGPPCLFLLGLKKFVLPLRELHVLNRLIALLRVAGARNVERFQL